MVHIPNKTGAAGMINDLVVGDAQVAFAQCGELGGDDQGRQAAAARGAGRGAAEGLSGRSDARRRRAFPSVGTLHWQSMLAPAATPKPVLDTLFKAIQEAAKKPELLEAFGKQLVSVKPNESLDEVAEAGSTANWRRGARSPPR